MAKPTQKEMRAAVTVMLKDALGELQGSIDLGLDLFTTTEWNRLGLIPCYGSHEKDECAFWIDNPHEKWRPILVKVTVPQTGQIGE